MCAVSQAKARAALALHTLPSQCERCSDCGDRERCTLAKITEGQGHERDCSEDFEPASTLASLGSVYGFHLA